MSHENSETPYRDGGFFVFRTPLLPFEELERWSGGLEAPGVGGGEALEGAVEADRERLRARLAELLGRPVVREALFVASPSLVEGLEAWRRRPGSKKGLRAERALVRYVVRMAGRATPFGLFSGCSLGVARLEGRSEPRLALGPRSGYRRHTRLDMDYLFALAEDLARQPELARELRYRPNTSLYRAGGGWRYAEARLDGKHRTYHLVAVGSTPYLDATLERARSGARREELAGALVADDAEVAIEEAREFIDELVASQLLVPELQPVVTGPDAAADLAAVLRAHGAGVGAAVHLERASETLSDLDAQGLGHDPERYRQLGRALEEGLPTEVEISRLFQVDMVKPAEGACLGEAVLAEMVRGVEILQCLAGAVSDETLERFRNAFAERYGDRREVPLVEVLDEEIGIGFGSVRAVGAEASPLLADLPFPAAEAAAKVPWGPRQAFLLRRVEEMALAGGSELQLSPEDLETLAVPEPGPLPDAFHVMGAVAARSPEAVARGEFRLHLRSVAGPSGARLLGRFCHADPRLLERVREHLAAEESSLPEAVYAEIVHLPQGRIGNILARPRLRAHEVPFLGRATVDEDHQIPVTDLRVSIVDRRVVLTSERLGREVVPRLTTAHNFVNRSLGIYRFLCALQSQGVAGGLGWSWGPLETAPFLPRVTVGRLVLVRARWQLFREEIEALSRLSGAGLLEHVRRLRQARCLPRWAVLVDGDNELPVDFENVLSLESFADLVKGRPGAVLKELFPGADDLWAEGPEGRFVHEVLVPFLRTRPPAEGAAEAPATAADAPSGEPARGAPAVARDFLPGSEWLFAKLYTGTATADAVLREVAAPTVREALASGAADGWFFIRYADPEWHVRLRLHGPRQRLWGEVLPRLEGLAAPLLGDRRLWRLQLDTYQRETTRYGGPGGIVLAEQLFEADSEAVLAILDLLAGDEGADARWRLALKGVDLLLDDLGLDLGARRDLLARLRDGYTAEFRATLDLKRRLGDRHRRERQEIALLLGSSPGEDHPLAPGLVLLAERSRRIAPIAQELRRRAAEGRLTVPLSGLAASFVHMHVNRFIRAEARAHELVLYELLYRWYNTRLAQGEKARSSRGVASRSR